MANRRVLQNAEIQGWLGSVWTTQRSRGVVDWVLLDWGVAARLAADDLVPEVQMLEARRTLERLKLILEAKGIVC
jgi:hypothetical protein